MSIIKIWGRSTNETMRSLIEHLNSNNSCFIEITDQSSVYSFYYKGTRFWTIGKVDSWNKLLAKKLGIELAVATNIGDVVTCKGLGYFIVKYDAGRAKGAKICEKSH